MQDPTEHSGPSGGQDAKHTTTVTMIPSFATIPPPTSSCYKGDQVSDLLAALCKLAHSLFEAI